MKHIQRTKTLLHLLDANEAEGCIENYRAIREELRLFDPELAEKPEIIVISKVDLISKHDLEVLEEMLRSEIPDREIFAVSGPIHEGLTELMDHLVLHYAPEEARESVEDGKSPITDLREIVDPLSYEVTCDDGIHYELTGIRIQQIVRMSVMGNRESTLRVYDIFMKLGVLREIGRMASAAFRELHPEHELQPGEIWHQIPDNAAITIE